MAPTNPLTPRSEPPASAGGEQVSTPADSPETLSWRRPAVELAAIDLGANFRILKELGKGGMGIVFLAEQQAPRRLVAVKTFVNQQALNAHSLERFAREANSAARLVHPHIVQVHDVQLGAKFPYLVLEYVEGGTLFDRTRGRKQDSRWAAELIAKAARAMQAAHAQRVIHRDLKPSNILLTRADEPKISDFGLAKQLDDAQGGTLTGEILGTPLYMAPEQARGESKEVGPAADIYALGAVLYELLTGDTPAPRKLRGNWSAILRSITEQNPTAPRRVSPEVPRDLETICLKCLEKDAARRYACMADLADDLERFLRGESVSARPPSWMERGWRWCRRKPTLAALYSAVVLLAIASSAAGLFFNRAVHSGRLAELRRALERELKADVWSEEHLAALNQLAAEITELAPADGDETRGKLSSALEAHILALLKRPRITSELKSQIEDRIRQLTAMSPAAALALEQRLQERAAALGPVFTLAPPFAELAAVFDHRAALVADKTLVRGDSGQVGESRWAVTKAESHRDMVLEVEFAPGWEQERELGAALNATTLQAYRFILRPTPVSAPDKPAVTATLDDARREGSLWRIEIWRNDQLLAAQEMSPSKVDAGGMRLTARRFGNRLECQVGSSEPLTFDELIPLEAASGRFGVLWPQTVGISRLEARARLLPSDPSPLEQADAALAAEDFPQARVLLNQQEIVLADAAADSRESLLREVRYKLGYCAAQLNQTVEAIAFWQALQNGGDSWSVRALCDLWLLQVRGKRLAEAELLADSAIEWDRERVGRSPRLKEILPLSIRQELAQAHATEFGGLRYLNAVPSHVTRLQRFVELETRFDLPRAYRGWHFLDLIRAQRFFGERAAAEVTLLDCLRPEQDWSGTPFRGLFLRELGWIRREVGSPLSIVGLIDAELEDPAPWGAYAGEIDMLLIERARALTVGGDTARGAGDEVQAQRLYTQASNDLKAYLERRGDDNHNYRDYSDACLLLGFLEEEAGNSESARSTWLRGRSPVNLDQGAFGEMGGTLGLLNHVMCSALGGADPAADVRKIADRTLANHFQGLQLFTVQTALSAAPIRCTASMWSTPRGKRLARDFAAQTITVVDVVRRPLALTFSEVCRTEAFGGEFTPDQEETVWQAGAGLAETAFAQRNSITGNWLLTRGLGSLGYWAGTTDVERFRDDTATLDANVRACTAYVLSQRCRQLGHEELAGKYLEVARADAPPSGPLRRVLMLEGSK